MVRSYWKGTLVLTLAWVGAARSQPTPPAPARPSAERLLSIQEDGKPAQKCRVLASWKLEDGSMAHQVQALGTGEISTIIDGPKPRVFPWGKQNTPPPGSPTPPSQAARTGSAPSGAIVPAGGAQGQPAAAAPSAAPEYRTIQEPGKAPQKCRVLRKWQMPNGLNACEVQSLETQEIMTLEEMGAPAPTPGTRAKAVATRIFHWGRNTTPPAGVPVPPAQVAAQTAPTPAVTAQAPARPATPPAPAVKPATPAVTAQAQSGLATPPAPTVKPATPTVAQVPTLPTPPKAAPQAPPRVSPPTPTPTGVTQASAPTPAAQSKAGPGLPPPPAVKSTVEPAKMTDVRKSWGGPDEIKTLPKPPASPTPPRAPASTSVADTAKDPLANPRDFASKSVQEKLPTFSARDDGKARPAQQPPAPVQTVSLKPQVPTPAGLAAASGPVSLPASPPPMPVKPATPEPVRSPAPAPKAMPAPQALPTSAPVEAPPHLGNPVPLGSQSVLAANNGLDRPIQYVPVPIVTVPQPNQPPMPPVPAIPQAPQSNQFVNAFSTPQQLHQMQMQQQGQQAPMMAGRMAPSAGMPGQAPMGMPHGYPPAYGQPMVPHMTHPQYPQNPQMQAGVMGARGYQGPQPPNPFAQPLAPMPQMPPMMTPGQVPMMQMPAPAMQQMPAMPMMPQSGMTADQAATANGVQQMIHVLRTSGYPSQREWAANNLATCDLRAHPQIVQALTTAATEDPAPTVRAGCVYNLARMRVATEPVMATLRQLKTDADPRVRQEAEQALARLAPASAPAAGQHGPGLVQPAGGVNRPQ